MAGIDKIRDEMAKTKDKQLGFLGEGLTALIGLYPGTEALIGADGKSLSGCLAQIKKAAVGGVADPETATRAICGYYGLDFKDFRRLAAEVNAAMAGGPLPSAPSALPPSHEGGPLPSAPSAPPPSPEGEGKDEHTQTPAGDDFDLDGLLEGL